MNFREGMRRLGILLGAAGGIMGGFLAFVPAFGNAPGVWNALTAHRKFEAAMALPTVQKAAKDIAARKVDAPGKENASRDSSSDWFAQNAPATSGGKPPDIDFDSLAAKYGWVPPNPLDLVSSEDQNGGITVFEANALLKGNRDGIKSIQFDSGKQVTAIRFATGEWIYRTEAPKFSAYLVMLAFPAFGFLLPWAAVRVVTWVGTGFFTPKSG
jgi:hypothetical protein